MTMNSFKLMTESLGLSVVRAAVLLQITPAQARHYANGASTAPPAVIERAEGLIRQVEDGARAFRRHPERLVLARALAPVLHRAVLRRIQEIAIFEAQARAGRKA